MSIFPCEFGIYFVSFSHIYYESRKNIIFYIGVYNTRILCGTSCISRSQWLRGLRHELSSLARTLGSWVRIPLKAWMSMCAFILCLLSCVLVAALRRADLSCKSPTVCAKKDYETEEEARAQQKGCRAIDE
jgi:hypothetical protein